MSYIRFTAAGEGLPAFRDALRTSGISCAFQQMRGGVFHAQTNVRNRRRLLALAAESGVTVQITGRHGLHFALMPYRFRFGIPVGALLAFALILWYTSAVRTIEIHGNQRVSEAEILQALSGLGIAYGTPFREIAFTHAEQRMRLAVSDIEWIALRHVGGRLVVDLTEERNPPEMERDRIPANVIAAETAQITEISVTGGTALRQRGEAVKAGDVIISGVRTDKFGISRYVRASGTVRGIYTDSFSQEQPFVAELPVHGNPVTETAVSLFGKRFYLPPRTEQPAAPSDYSEEETALTLFDRTLPFSLIRCTYTPLETLITAYSEAEAKALLTESAARWEQNFHGNDRLISRNAEFSRTDLGISLNINYTFEGVIGETSEFFVKLS